MDGRKKSVCKGCGKAVLFALDDKGKVQILDPSAPIWVFAAGVPASPDRVSRLADAYVSHFSTCPDAAHFSKNKKCDCGHSKAEHPDMRCLNDWCVCPAFQRKEPTL